jgi:hypothetical protein
VIQAEDAGESLAASSGRTTKPDFALSGYRLRRFLRFSEATTRRNGVTTLQYLLLQIVGFPRAQNGQRPASLPVGPSRRLSHSSSPRLETRGNAPASVFERRGPSRPRRL